MEKLRLGLAIEEGTERLIEVPGPEQEPIELPEEAPVEPEKVPAGK